MSERTGIETSALDGTNPRHRLIHGDALDKLDEVADGSCRLIVTSPPYNIGKEYERDKRLTLDQYLQWLEPIVDKLCDKVADDGHICWQTGSFIDDGEVFPLDIFFYRFFKQKGFKLRNRIIWHFNFGLHAQNRFSGRYETMLWFTKGDDYVFNLDPVRVPQRYPGKRHSAKKGERAGKPSGNPLGKNPSDFWQFDAEDAFKVNPIWDFPNVKAKHPEKTVHPCQFPLELVERCVLALTGSDDLILDPFVGSGTTAVAAMMHERRVVGIDQDSRYIGLAEHRLQLLEQGELPRRPLGTPVRAPRAGEGVAQMPLEWLEVRKASGDDCDRGNHHYAEAKAKAESETKAQANRRTAKRQKA
jgi:DNA modification methylase